jgi:hypothetical protein
MVVRGAKQKSKLGKRVFKRPVLTSTARMLDSIYTLNGGTTVLAKRLGTNPQNLNLWRKWGYIPLRHVGKIANILKLPCAAFNFCDWVKATNDEMEWADVVKSCKLPDNFERFVLAGKMPPKIKEIV